MFEDDPQKLQKLEDLRQIVTTGVMEVGYTAGSGRDDYSTQLSKDINSMRSLYEDLRARHPHNRTIRTIRETYEDCWDTLQSSANPSEDFAL